MRCSTVYFMLNGADHPLSKALVLKIKTTYTVWSSALIVIFLPLCVTHTAHLYLLFSLVF